MYIKFSEIFNKWKFITHWKGMRNTVVKKNKELKTRMNISSQRSQVITTAVGEMRYVE